MEPINYQTSTGVTLEIQRIPRKVIDQYTQSNPMPEPPTVEVPVFGGGVEKVEDLEDPEFQAELMAYNLRMAHKEFDIVAQAVRVKTDWQSDPRVEDMRSLGFDLSNKVDYLRYIALSDTDDLVKVTELILYMSTVTQRGIEEAERAFNIHLDGIPLNQYPNPTGNLRVSAYYQAREAAQKMGYKWQEFSELSGPEQSAVVAHYLCETKIQWLIEKRNADKAKAKAKTTMRRR